MKYLAWSLSKSVRASLLVGDPSEIPASTTGAWPIGEARDRDSGPSQAVVFHQMRCVGCKCSVSGEEARHLIRIKKIHNSRHFATGRRHNGFPCESRRQHGFLTVCSSASSPERLQPRDRILAYQAISQLPAVKERDISRKRIEEANDK